jgi:hypothetical protein
MQAPAPVDSIPKREIDVANKKLHVVPNETKSSVVLEAFDTNDSIVAAITSWDQIGSLSSEVSTSLLAKQASIICERFRAESSEPEQRPSKRRKIGTPSEDDSSKDEHDSSTSSSSDDSSEKDEQRVVSSDEESSTSSSESPLPGCVSQQVDRMARMSKLLLEMENYHRLYRMEMIAMAKDSGVDLDFS